MELHYTCSILIKYIRLCAPVYPGSLKESISLDIIRESPNMKRQWQRWVASSQCATDYNNMLQYFALKRISWIQIYHCKYTCSSVRSLGLGEIHVLVVHAAINMLFIYLYTHVLCFYSSNTYSLSGLFKVDMQTEIENWHVLF